MGAVWPGGATLTPSFVLGAPGSSLLADPALPWCQGGWPVVALICALPLRAALLPENKVLWDCGGDQAAA